MEATMDNDNIHSAYRGDIFYADLEPVRGSEQGGVRPVLIIQNDIGNRHSPTVIVAAITSRIKHHRLPTHVNLNGRQCGLHNESTIMLEQLRTLDKQRLLGYAGTVGKGKMQEVNAALEISNSFCHKEYGTGQNNEVSIYKDRVEIYNPGTFPAGYEPEDFISGRERPIRRNPLIAQTLYYSKNVESFGTGLKRIAEACDAAGCKYKFEVLKSGFVVVFYRSDENFDTTGTDTTPVTIPVNTPDKDIRSKIVSLCLNAPQTREQLMQACGMKNKAHFLKAYLKPMLETGELQLTVPDKPNSRNQKYIAVRHTTGEVR